MVDISYTKELTIFMVPECDGWQESLYYFMAQRGCENLHSVDYIRYSSGRRGYIFRFKRREGEGDDY